MKTFRISLQRLFLWGSLNITMLITMTGQSRVEEAHMEYIHRPKLPATLLSACMVSHSLMSANNCRDRNPSGGSHSFDGTNCAGLIRGGRNPQGSTIPYNAPLIIGGSLGSGQLGQDGVERMTRCGHYDLDEINMILDGITPPALKCNQVPSISYSIPCTPLIQLTIKII